MPLVGMVQREEEEGTAIKHVKKPIGIVAKPNSSMAKEAIQVVVRVLEENGVPIYVERDTAESYSEELAGYPVFHLDSNPPERMIVIGGDGTLLRTIMKLKDSSPIIMGVRAGKRGFLLDVERYEIEDRVRDFINGSYRVEVYPRNRVYYADKPLPCVLNDAVLITKMAKMVKLSVYVDGDRIMGIDGDGVIISTTVGSSAYSLSAGGPIIDPRLDINVVTPLNPVQLYLRPIVLPADAIIEVEVSPGSNDLYLSLDGQEVVDVSVGDVITVRRCESPVKMARFKWWENYYERLYARLLAYW